MKGNAPLLILTVLVLGGLAFAGQSLGSKFTGEAGERLIESAIERESGQEANVDLDNGAVTITSDDGQASFGAGSSLPAGFPADVPTPHDGTLTGSFSKTEDGTTTYSLIYTVSHNSTLASEEYQAQLRGTGFSVTASGSASTGEVSYSSFEAIKDSTQISVAVSGDSQQTTLTIVVVVTSA